MASPDSLKMFLRQEFPVYVGNWDEPFRCDRIRRGIYVIAYTQIHN